MSPMLAAVALTATHNSATSPVAYVNYVAGGKSYHMVQADLSSDQIEADTIYSSGIKGPWHLISQTEPIAAITGTFFAPSNGHPVADVVLDGKMKARGNRGTVLAIAKDGSVSIENRAFRHKFDWNGFRAGLRGGVRLIQNGKVCPNPKAQHFKDPRIWGRASRTGVGLTHSGKVVLIATSAQVTLSEFGRAMKKKGVVDAVSLDGGGSTCLYYRGNMILKPDRGLSNMFVIKRTAFTSNKPKTIAALARR